MIFLPEAISSTTLSVLIQYQHPLTPFLRQNCAWGPMPTHAQSCELLQGRGGEQTSGKFEVIAGAGGKFVAPLLGGMAHQMRGQRKFRRGNQCMKGVLVVGLVSLLGLSLLPEAHALNRKVNRDEGAGVEEGSIPVSCNTYSMRCFVLMQVMSIRRRATTGWLPRQPEQKGPQYSIPCSHPLSHCQASHTICVGSRRR